MDDLELHPDRFLWRNWPRESGVEVPEFLNHRHKLFQFLFSS